ncbi:hypothetical protein F4813DRAFT_401162 [Daldinia decipiens]|uniref:uncharacterized protein n=1 Tax=Daldinia decipiens TaxID=326647 RepID=UPI0020C2D664|nr:uncharacterized protein F4813DRAFT_401162 [Daldinia decipiens]KAI1660197.1 hypothetical protein F4813DRAFT_401162 [Daldinia decipiens]
MSGEKKHDDQEAGNTLSSNLPSQFDGHKSSGKGKMKAEHQEQQSGASRGHQQSYSAVNSTTANASTSTQAAQAADLEKLEQRRRLDDIVKDHIDDFGIVYDRPGAATGDSPDGSWMMAGGLVTDPLQVQGLWDAKMSTSSLSLLGEDSNGNGELEVANQEISGLEGASTFQDDDRAALPNDIHNTIETSSSDPSTAASSPTLHTMQARRRQSGSSAHPTQIRGPLPPRYSDRVMPTVTPAFAPTTFRRYSQMDGPAQEEADEDEDDYYAGPVNGNPFRIPASYSTVQPRSQAQSRAGPYFHRPSVFAQPGLRPASSPIPRPIDDLVTLVGVPGVGVPGTESVNNPSSSRRCQGRCINRRLGLAQALARDRMVLEKEKELWTMMMGF